MNITAAKAANLILDAFLVGSNSEAPIADADLRELKESVSAQLGQGSGDALLIRLALTQGAREWNAMIATHT